jgi:hypothetical protein
VIALPEKWEACSLLALLQDSSRPHTPASRGTPRALRRISNTYGGRQATEGDEATAEEALDTVFRTAFHEIYRRLPLFKGAVVKSEREFARVQTKLNEIHAVKEAEKQLLKDELISTHTALQVSLPTRITRAWRRTTVRAPV